MLKFAAFKVEVPRRWLLTSNQRLHWREVARRAALLRTTAGFRAGSTLDRDVGGFVDQVRCQVDVSWPNRRRRDVMNLSPTIKHCIDGAVDSGLLADDSDRHLIGPDLRVTDELCDKDFACTLTFTFQVA